MVRPFLPDTPADIAGDRHQRAFLACFVIDPDTRVAEVSGRTVPIVWCSDRAG